MLYSPFGESEREDIQATLLLITDLYNYTQTIRTSQCKGQYAKILQSSIKLSRKEIQTNDQLGMLRVNVHQLPRYIRETVKDKIALMRMTGGCNSSVRFVAYGFHRVINFLTAAS